MKPLTPEERYRLNVLRYRENHTLEETSDVFGISVPTIVNRARQYKEEGTLFSKKKGGANNVIVTQEGKDFIAACVGNENDITAEAISDLYWEKFAVSISGQTVSRHLKKMGYTRKKSRITTRKDMGPSI